MNLLLVDDHPLVRGALRRLLAEHFEGATFGEASNAADGIRMASSGGWDLMLLDLSMPGRSGLEALTELRSSCPKLPVLIVTMHLDEQYAIRAFRSGAAGYVMKDCAQEEFCLAVEKALAGGKYITAQLAEALAVTLASPARSPHEELSDRELQVLRMLGSGETVKTIGEELSLSAKTVSTYRTRILKKMEMRTTAQLVRYALASGLVE